MSTALQGRLTSLFLPVIIWKVNQIKKRVDDLRRGKEKERNWYGTEEKNIDEVNDYGGDVYCGSGSLIADCYPDAVRRSRDLADLCSGAYGDSAGLEAGSGGSAYLSAAGSRGRSGIFANERGAWNSAWKDRRLYLWLYFYGAFMRTGSGAEEESADRSFRGCGAARLSHSWCSAIHVFDTDAFLGVCASRFCSISFKRRHFRHSGVCSGRDFEESLKCGKCPDL